MSTLRPTKWYLENAYAAIVEAVELGKSMKTLMMHYYGNGEGVFQDAVDDVENGIDRVKNFTEEKWNDFNIPSTNFFS